MEKTKAIDFIQQSKAKDPDDFNKHIKPNGNDKRNYNKFMYFSTEQDMDEILIELLANPEYCQIFKKITDECGNKEAQAIQFYFENPHKTATGCEGIAPKQPAPHINPDPDAKVGHITSVVVKVKYSSSMAERWRLFGVQPYTTDVCLQAHKKHIYADVTADKHLGKREKLKPKKISEKSTQKQVAMPQANVLLPAASSITAATSTLEHPQGISAQPRPATTTTTTTTSSSRTTTSTSSTSSLVSEQIEDVSTQPHPTSTTATTTSSSSRQSALPAKPSDTTHSPVSGKSTLDILNLMGERPSPPSSLKSTVALASSSSTLPSDVTADISNITSSSASKRKGKEEEDAPSPIGERSKKLQIDTYDENNKGNKEQTNTPFKRP